MQDWVHAQYEEAGDDTSDGIAAKEGPAALLQATACARINKLLDTHRTECSFSLHPARQDPESQVTGPLCVCMETPSALGCVMAVWCNLFCEHCERHVAMQVAGMDEHCPGVQLEAEELQQGIAPDICLLRHGGLQRRVVQTTTCSTK